MSETTFFIGATQVRTLEAKLLERDLDYSRTQARARAQAHAIPLPTTPAMRAFWGPAKDALTGVLRQDRPAQSALSESAGRLAHLLAPLPAKVHAGPWIGVLAILLLGLAFIVAKRWMHYTAPVSYTHLTLPTKA